MEIKIVNPMTGKGLPEALVLFKLGTEAEQSKKTGTDGTLSLGQVKFGTQISILAKKDMFSDGNAQVTVGESACGNPITIGMTPEGTRNTIVLLWAKKDLDLHLLNPTCGVDWQKTTCTVQGEKNTLEVDSKVSNLIFIY